MTGDVDFETHPHGTKKALEDEIVMLRGELETQAQNAVTQIANLIERTKTLSQAMLPCALAHTSADPYHALTLDHLRKAHETLNGKE